MKLVTYKEQIYNYLGIWHDNKIYNLEKIAASKNTKKTKKYFPNRLIDLLNLGDTYMNEAKKYNEEVVSGQCSVGLIDPQTVTILAPLPHPTSCRDAYAFRQHVAAARRNRKVEMIPEFDQYPIFYFTNHNAIQGAGDIKCMPDHFKQLDFELEAAVVIGKQGMNIKAEEADKYIAGYMIMNDLSARVLQMEEMKLNLGPSKGKDFCTVIGPWFVTPDELEPYRIAPKENHTGNNYRLDMKCRVNGKLVSQGNMGDMDWTFAEIIERCAYGVNILPGDVIGSGTVGTGCFLELNGTGLLNDPNYKTQWLQEGDEVEMEITGLGCLKNTIRKMNSDFSILALKKNLVAAT